MVDRATFRRLNPNYVLPTPVPLKAEENTDPATINGFDSYNTPVLPFDGTLPSVNNGD